MKPISFATVVATCTAVVLVAGSAQAQTVTQAKCRSTIAKTITKYQAGLVKSVALCHKLRNLNKAPYNGLNCNDVTLAANTKGLLQSTRDKNTALIVKLCETVPGLKGTAAETAALLPLFPRCPSPAKTVDDISAGGTGNTTDGIDTFTELAKCELALSEAYVSRVAEQAFGLPAIGAAAVKSPISNCQGAIGKALGKALGTYPKTRMKCQGTADKAASGLTYSCATNDSLGLIAAAVGATGTLNTAIGTGCTGTDAELFPMGACSTNAAGLKKCITDRMVKRVGGGLVAMAYELPTGQCSAYADVLINAGYKKTLIDQAGAKVSNTELDSGYTGSGHNVDLENDYLGGVKLTGCDADCSGCTVTLDPSPAGKKYAAYNTCRCDNDATVACNLDDAHIEQSDPLCGGNTCHCYFGPPLPLSAAAAPVCVTNRFQGDFVGGLTGEVGEYDVPTRTAALVHLGISQTQPCPTCVGDTTANDGTRGGSCNGGSRDTLPCDVNANSPDFGPTSFDCQPVVATNISGTGLKLNLTFTDGTQTITAGIPTGPLCAAGTCHCAQCSGNSTVGCSSDADCALFGAGTCTNAAGGSGKQNSCVGLACNDDGTGTNQGECDGATPTMLFCDGQLRGNGEGYIACDAGGQADCDAMDADCTGSDCGICGGAGAGGPVYPGGALRKCFLPTVTATGTPGIFGSEGVATFCSANTSNAGVNAAGGLPGPGRVKLDFDFDLYCADHSTPYDLPGGSNCP